MKLIVILVSALGASLAKAVTIDAVYFGQTHVLKATDPLFGLVGNREALIKVHVTDPAAPTSPAVTATLSLGGQTLVVPLTGPATLPASIPDGLGVVQHSFANTFTGYLPAAWVKTGLQVTVNAGPAGTTITNMKVGAPSEVIMTMFDVHYFSQATGNYPANTFAELEAKWPVADLEVRRLSNVVFPELVIPPRGGAPAARVKSKAEYTAQTGLAFDGEQAAALEWNAALKRAAGRSGRWSLYYLNIYNANAGGQAGGFAGVGNGTSEGILHHELGHALSLPHWGDNAAYPYKGDLHGIPAPSNYNGTHAGPAWAFDLRTKAFIPPTVQSGNVGGKPVGTYKVDPMQGGGTGFQEPGYLLNHFSDYSMNQMRSYLHSHMVLWNPALGSNGSWASWNQTAGGYTTAVSNNGVQFPSTRDTQVITILATLSGVKPDVNMVYPPIGPYTSGLIRLFDPTVAADRTAANSIFSPGSGSDYCVRVVQGGVQKTYMLAASALTSPAPTDAASLETEAINLPASGGAVTKIELLSTPNVEDNGLPANPAVLYTWAPLTPDAATFETAPVAYGSSAITMKATEGELAFGYSGTVEYLFTETTGNPGASSSAWQTSRSYTDIGLNPGTPYAYTVSMRAGTLATAPSAAASATPFNAAASVGVTVDSTQQFSLQSGSGLKAVTGLGTFNASGADKLVVVISTEDANNAGTAFVYDVRYNGKVMTEAIQEDGGAATGTAAIFYLDNPGSIGSGTIQVSAENPNGGIGCAYALSNTMPGFGSSNSRTGTTANSVSLTTAGDGSVVIAVLDNAGKPNTVGTTHTATSPLFQASSGAWGSQWGGHASGHRSVASPTAITAAFATATGTGYSINIAAVEFPAQPPVPSRWIQTAGNSQNWTTAANWDDGIVPNPTSGTTMDFGTVNITANTNLNLGADRTARLWKFGDTSGSQRWTVGAGQTLTLAGTTPGFQINNGTTQIDSVVAGSAGLTKSGAGNLTLAAANTYNGPTTVTAGTLQIGNAGTTGSIDPASAITNDASMVFNRTNTITQGIDFASLISGSGSLTKNSSGTLILSGDNTYTGATTITAGTLQLGNGGGTGKLAVSSAITNNAALVFNRSNGVIQGSGFANAITGSGSLTNIGNGTLTLNTENTYAGLTSVEAGSIKVLHANALGTTAAGTVVNGSTTGSAANARLELEGGITVTGEALTLNGVGNFQGALSSTSGSNTWAGNVTIGSAGTRLGATTGNTLTVSGIIDSGAVDTGLIIRTQDLDSPVILSGANTYLGDTTVLIGKLRLDGGNDRLPVATKLILGSSGTNPDAEFDLNGRNQEVAGLSLTGTGSKNSVNNSSLTMSMLTVNTSTPSTFGGILKGNLSLVKTGADTLTLSGLSATAADNPSGPTVIDAGTLAISANHPSFTGGLTFGSANGSATRGAMDLGSSSASFAGLALVRTDSAAANAISIGATRTLTLNGGLTLGYDAGAGTGQTNSRLTVTGGGSLAVSGTTITIGVNQAATNAAYSNRGTLDVSELAAFGTNVTNFNIGVGNNTHGPGDVLLSNTSNTILATTLTVGNTGSNNGYGTSTLTLGAGSNLIQADTIHIGRNKGSGPGVVKFASQTTGSPGTVTLANKAGSGRANIDIANQLSNGTAGGAVGTLDLRGHAATVSAETVTIGAVTAGGSGGPNGTLSFDAGTFDVNTLNLAPKTGASSGTSRATVNIGGGSFTVNTSFTLGSQAGGGFSVATLNLSGGTLTSHVDLVGGAGATTSTLTLNGAGAVLDMTGDDITGLDSITFTDGTLRNLGVVNTGIALAGTGSRVFDQASGVAGDIQAAVSGPGAGFTKQGLGTLTLSAINTYTGDTTVSAGTLVLADNARLRFVIGATSGSNNRITGTGTVSLHGDFDIDTSLTDASVLTTGSWTLVEAATLAETFGSSFTLTGPGWSEASDVWTKTIGNKKYTFTEATGILTLGSAASYATWIEGFFPGESDPAIIGEDADPDHDGIPSGVEIVIGGDPKAGMDSALLPTLERVIDPLGTPAIPAGDYLLFTYRRSDLSVAAGVMADCETDIGLAGPWTPATGAPGVVVQVDDNFSFTPPAAADTDRVRVYVPRGAYGTLFGRLKVHVPPP